MTLATETDACREYVRNVGRDQLNRAWILTPFDTWESNPFYVGAPVPHPEDDETMMPAAPYTGSPVETDEIVF